MCDSLTIMRDSLRMKVLGFGIFITLLGGSLWGVSGICMQYLTVQVGLDPSLVTLLRVACAGLLYLGYLLIACRAVLRAMFSKFSTIALLLLFTFALYSNQLFYAEAVHATNAGTATVLQMLECVFVLAFVCLYQQRFPSAREIAGLCFALLATLLIATQGDLTTLALPADGLMWGLLSAFAAAAYILIPKQSGLFETYGAIPVVGIGMVLAPLFAVPTYFFQGGDGIAIIQALTTLSIFDWTIFVFGLVLLGTIVGFVAYLYGTSLVGPVRGALLGAIEPVSATIMSAFFLGTLFTEFDIAGMLIMCVMVFLISGKN